MRRYATGIRLAFLTILSLLWPATLRAGEEEVDVALVIAVDISYSMDLEEQRLQRQGYIDALNSAEVQRAIRMGMVGRIAISYFEWANALDQRMVVPWTIIDGPETTRAVTDQIAATPIRRAQRTSISGALNYGRKLLEVVPYRALRKVIDVSGDGPNNAGEGVEIARDRVLGDGITINGLPVMIKRSRGGWGDIDNLDAYYQDCVIGGQGAFVIPITEMEHFLTATKQKIIREVAELGISDLRHVQSEMKSDCLIGEKRVRDRWGN
ncbi:MAG: DUF1194 domain-containing protein [Proteobacteria bacterium]|nr:DUF1194 domain-containing protein [Pseudomonadota bacterium]